MNFQLLQTEKPKPPLKRPQLRSWWPIWVKPLVATDDNRVMKGARWSMENGGPVPVWSTPHHSLQWWTDDKTEPCYERLHTEVERPQGKIKPSRDQSGTNTRCLHVCYMFRAEPGTDILDRACHPSAGLPFNDPPGLPSIFFHLFGLKNDVRHPIKLLTKSRLNCFERSLPTVLERH